MGRRACRQAGPCVGPAGPLIPARPSLSDVISGAETYRRNYFAWRRSRSPKKAHRRPLPLGACHNTHAAHIPQRGAWARSPPRTTYAQAEFGCFAARRHTRARAARHFFSGADCAPSSPVDGGGCQRTPSLLALLFFSSFFRCPPPRWRPQRRARWASGCRHSRGSGPMPPTLTARAAVAAAGPAARRWRGTPRARTAEATARRPP